MMEISTQEWASLVYHEAGHAAIAWHFRYQFERRGILMDAKRRRGKFHFTSYVTPESLQGSLETTRAGEREILRLLGGMVAEYLYFGNGKALGEKAIRFSQEYRDPNSDCARIRAVLHAISGGDDKALQVRLQIQCRGILEERRTWRAIEAVASQVVETAPSVERRWSLFSEVTAPQ